MMDEQEPKDAEELQTMNTDIEGVLMEGLDDDPRLGNGVPSHLRGSDLDFIQMSGLTVTSDGEEIVEDMPDEDMDPNVPVSFYEEGVDDVDSRRAPLGTEPEAGSADEVIVPRPRAAMLSSIESLKEIVADLTSRESSSSELQVPTAPPPVVDEASGTEYQEVESLVIHEEIDFVEDIVVPDDGFEPEPDLPLNDSPLSGLGPLPEQDDAHDSPPAPTSKPEVFGPAVEPEPESREAPPPINRRPDLARAESLLQRLEAEAGSDDDGEVFKVPEIPEATVPDDDGAETDESVYNRPNTPPHRYSKRRRVRRRLFRLFSLMVLLAALAVGGFYAYMFYKEQTATDADHYRAAMRLAERDRHAEAGVAFAAFASRYPDSSLSGDALLMAAHSYERTGDDAAAVRLYELFRTEYPAHPKIHRATTLLALAKARNGEYEKAITMLQDPDRRRLDPDGYLASLRALGEAHAALNQIDEARSAYLRAASLQGNYTADEDYLALAELYQSQAETAVDGESRRRYLGLAVDQWDFAMRSPGITESRRRDIKTRRDLTISELGKVALNADAPPVDMPVAPAVVEPGGVPPVKPADGTADDSIGLEQEVAAPADSAAEGQGVARNREAEQAQLLHID